MLGHKFPLSLINGLYKGEKTYHIISSTEGGVPTIDGKTYVTEVYVIGESVYDVKSNIDAIIQYALDMPDAKEIFVFHRGPVQEIEGQATSSSAFVIIGIGIKYKDGTYQMFSGGTETREVTIRKNLSMPKYTPKIKYNETSDKEKIHAE